MDAITFLQQLVAISSLSGAEQEASHWMAEQMAQLGFDAAFVDSAGNSVGIRANPDENGAITKELMLLGHIDTVPGDIPVRIEEGKLYGRGSVDAKGPLATFVMAAAQAQLPTGVRVVVVGAVEEEAATSKGARHVLTQYRPDWCIIGEPSGWNGVTLGYKGRILIDYHHGQGMSHTAGELLGSAEVGIAWYNQLIAYVTAYNETRPKLFDQILPSIRSISTQSDGMINAISIKLGLRLPPQFDIDEFEIVNGNNCIVCAVGGVPYDPVVLLTSTNMLTPIANWQRAATNHYDASGVVHFTNIVVTPDQQRYYRLSVE